MRVTSWLALGGLVVLGIIGANALAHPQGTKAAGDVIVSLEKNTGNQLLGKAA